MGNSQLYDQQAMQEALRRSLHSYYTTISTFMVSSGLKYGSAKRYLDSLCQGDDARFHTYKEGNTRIYAVKKKYQEEFK